MISVSDPASVQYSYGEAAGVDADVRYAYSQANVHVHDMDAVYSWGLETDRWDRKAGFWAYSTQEIGNIFPRWHAARLNTGGNTQELINAWGIGFDKMKMQFGRFRRDLFIDTAELEQPDVFYHAGTVDIGDAPEKDRFKNLLSNPAFSHRGLARRNTPIDWTTWRAKTTGIVSLVDEPVFVGSHSVKLHAAAGESCYLAQSVQTPIEKGYSLTASFWYLVPIPEGVVEKDEHRAGIYMMVMYTNGSADIVRKALDLGTDGKWRRAAVTLDLTKEVFSITVAIQIENDTANPIRIYAGAAQLERSKVPTPWSESFRTIVPYQNEDSIVGAPVDVYVDYGTTEKTETIVPGHPVTYDARSGRTLLQVKDTFALWYDAIPTKATPTLVTDVPDAKTYDQFGWYSNPERERFNTRWRVTDNKIEQYNASIPAETICLWDIGELYLDEDFRVTVGIYSSDEDSSFSRTIEAVMVFKELLWVLCKEVEDGVTTRVLKIVDPWSRWPVPLAYDQELPCLHLECLGDVDVGISTGSADYIGVLTEDPDKLLIRVSDVYYTVALEFDRYVFDYQRARIITRSAFTGGELVTV